MMTQKFIQFIQDAVPNTPRRAPRPPQPGAPRAVLFAGPGGTDEDPADRRSRRACACIGSAPGGSGSTGRSRKS